MSPTTEKYAGRLAPGMAEYLARYDAMFAHNAVDLTAEDQRRMFRELCQAFAGPRPDGLEVRDAAIPGEGAEVPVRIYGEVPDVPQPGLMFFHGGGWVVGDLDSHDAICSGIAVRSDCVVVAVDYRLSPEHVFPAAFNDSWAATRHVADNPEDYGIDPGRLGVCGDSAGANLAAAVALKARDLGWPLFALQILIYPSLGCDFTLPSYAENADAPALTTADVRKYLALYLGHERYAEAEPYAVPLLAGDFSGLPPAAILACELDPMCDDASAYAGRLREAGVAADYWLGKGLVHGVLRARDICAEAGRLFDEICDAARSLHED